MKRRVSGGVQMRACSALTSLAIVVACTFMPASAHAAEATASIQVQARMSSRTALTVSTQSLHFTVAHPAEAATASVDFSAAARTHAGADVVLSIEIPRAIEDGEKQVAEARLTFAGEGVGTRDGAIATAAPSVAARWIGSGRRSGRLVFTLRARAAGAYTVPVRFMLAAP